MTSFALKIIAIVSMFCDHFGDAYVGSFSIFNLIGRIAFPIFAFQISEGFIHTKSIKKYFLRLGIFALISQIPFWLFAHKFLGTNDLSLNVFFTLFLGLLGIYLYDYILKLFQPPCSTQVTGLNLPPSYTRSDNRTRRICHQCFVS